MTDEIQAIWIRYRAILKARRDAVAEAMREYDEAIHKPALNKLREECELAGHNWQFSHIGPLGNAWDQCINCGSMGVTR